LLVSVPAVLLLNLAQWGGEFKVWIALVLGVLASAYAQNRAQKRVQNDVDRRAQLSGSEQ
jgi:hypothetical protein